MKNIKINNDYFDFFQELPQTDYLADIEIQDEYEYPSDTTPMGLSDEQVSQLALDSLDNARLSHPNGEIAPDSEPPQLSSKLTLPA
jgi:hypothetical protein